MPWKIPTAAAWQKFQDQFHGSQMVTGPSMTFHILWMSMMSFLSWWLIWQVVFFLLDYDVNFPWLIQFIVCFEAVFQWASRSLWYVMGSLVSHRQIFLEVTAVWNDRERPGNAEERSLILCRGAGRITSRASSVQWKDGSTSLAKIHTTSFSGCVFFATTSTALKKRCHKGENHGNGSNGSHSFIPSCHFFGGSNRQGQNCSTGLLWSILFSRIPRREKQWKLCY